LLVQVHSPYVEHVCVCVCVCVSGGTLVTVYGKDLTSVAEPRITVTTVTTTYHNVTYATESTNVTDSEVGWIIDKRSLQL